MEIFQQKREVITSIILIRIADIPGSQAKNKLCMKLTHKDLESCLSRTCSFYSITSQCLTWRHMIVIKMCKVKILFNKFQEISGKIRINF